LAAGTDDGAPPVDFVAPALPYNSIFTEYQRFRDEPVGSWPAANDTVGRLGGWRYYLEEAAQPTGHGGHP
jgi:hypothetical protein